MDLAVLLILIVLVIVMFKDIKWVSYIIGIIEIFLRLFHYIGDNLHIIEVNNIIDKYLPSSIFGILSNYTSGAVYVALSWVVVAALCLFLYYTICYFIKKK